MTKSVDPPPWKDALIAALDVDELIETTCDLIRCPSVNPPGDEGAVAAKVSSHLSRVEVADVKQVEAAPGRVSLVARWGREGGRVLAWNGHMDVVPVGDAQSWQHPPFAAHVASGRVWGRGATDMKGSIACIIEALAILRRANVHPSGQVVLEIVADEETGGGFGTGYLCEHNLLPRADGAICGEPTGLTAVTSARGRLWLDITTLGVSAHAACPEQGINAISAMRKVLDALDCLTLPSEVHPLVGSATLTATALHGGTTANTVPDRCTLSLDRRFLPSEDPDAVRGQIETILKRIADTGVECVMSERALFSASDIDPDADVVRAVQNATQTMIGRRASIGGIPGSTDARFLIERGIPTVILGPGQFADAHTTDESIAINHLVDGALVYAAAICQFLGVDSS